MSFPDIKDWAYSGCNDKQTVRRQGKVHTIIVHILSKRTYYRTISFISLETNQLHIVQIHSCFKLRNLSKKHIQSTKSIDDDIFDYGLVESVLNFHRVIFERWKWIQKQACFWLVVFHSFWQSFGQFKFFTSSDYSVWPLIGGGRFPCKFPTF